MGADLVLIGLVPSLNQPGSNVTGVYQFTTGLEEKRLGLLHEMVPKIGVIGVLINPNYSAADSQLHDVKEAAGRLVLAGSAIFWHRFLNSALTNAKNAA